MLIAYPYPDYGPGLDARFREVIKPFTRECNCQDSDNCGLCNSRLYPVTLVNGQTWDMDWGDQAIIQDGQLINIIKGPEWKDNAGKPVIEN